MPNNLLVSLYTTLGTVNSAKTIAIRVITNLKGKLNLYTLE